MRWPLRRQVWLSGSKERCILPHFWVYVQRYVTAFPSLPVPPSSVHAGRRSSWTVSCQVAKGQCMVQYRVVAVLNEASGECTSDLPTSSESNNGHLLLCLLCTEEKEEDRGPSTGRSEECNCTLPAQLNPGARHQAESKYYISSKSWKSRVYNQQSFGLPNQQLFQGSSTQV